MQLMDIDISSSWPSFVVLQLKQGLEERFKNRYFIIGFTSLCFECQKLLIVLVAVTLGTWGEVGFSRS